MKPAADCFLSQLQQQRWRCAPLQPRGAPCTAGYPSLMGFLKSLTLLASDPPANADDEGGAVSRMLLGPGDGATNPSPEVGLRMRTNMNRRTASRASVTSCERKDPLMAALAAHSADPSLYTIQLTVDGCHTANRTVRCPHPTKNETVAVFVFELQWRRTRGRGCFLTRLGIRRPTSRFRNRLIPLGTAAFLATHWSSRWPSVRTVSGTHDFS
jgi:hypothetical protein